MAKSKYHTSESRLPGASAAPRDLPADPQRFWNAGSEFPALTDPPGTNDPPALKQLGPLPFPRSSFPVVGFLATLCEHVAARAGEALKPKQ